jgi:glycosyltransferase involved in cell wall biosynthesis
MAKICIVLATYNGKKYLQEMLDSLVRQTRAADMIIAVDDGSTDSTMSILEQNLDRLPMDIVHCPKNQGHRAAFSLGLEEARRRLSEDDYIALADQDDIWLPDKLETLENEIGDAALIYGDAEVIDGKGALTAPSWRALSNIDTHCSIRRQIAGINNVTGCLSLFRASLLPLVLPLSENVTVHDRWIAMYAQKNGGIKAIPKIVAQYRIHGNNAVGGARQPPMSETLATQQKWIEEILCHRHDMHLNHNETRFAEKLLEITLRRQVEGFIPTVIPWVFANRNFLFLKDSAFKTLRRVLFTAIGLPLAKRFFGKD